MKLTIETQYGTVIIERPGDDLDVHNMVDDVFKPALAAMGYHHESIAEAFNEDQDLDLEEIAPDVYVDMLGRYASSDECHGYLWGHDFYVRKLTDRELAMKSGVYI